MDAETRTKGLADNRALEALLQKVTRVEVIDEGGRIYCRWNVEMSPSLQDDGRTLKVFVSALGPAMKDRHFPRWRV